MIGKPGVKTVMATAAVSLSALCTAQSTAWAAASDAPQPDSVRSSDIIVTARKRTEFQRDVPISVEALSGTQLAETKITQIVDLQARIPTLTISYGQVSPFLEIRGFGTGNNLSFDQAVGKFIDNVSFGRENDIRLPLFDLERVEVLKGPQVLLYGNSATAGALNIATRSPGQQFAADISTAYEFNNNELVVQGGVTVPISPIASLRVSGLFQDLRKGPTFNTFTGDHGPNTRNYAARGVLLVTPAEGLQFRLKAEYDHLRDTGVSQEAVAQPIGFDFYPETALNGVTGTGVNTAPFFARAFNRVNNEIYQLDINHDIGEGRLTSTTAYRDLRYAGSTPNPDIFPLFNGYQSYDYRQISQELRYSGTFGALDVTAGGYYQGEKLSIQTAVDANLAAAGAPIPPFAFNFTMPQKTDSKSAFVDLTYHFTPQLSLEAGVRYLHVLRRADQAAFATANLPNKGFHLPPGGLQRDPAFDQLFGIFFFGSLPHLYENLRAADEFVQPQAVLQYKFADKNQAYFRYVKGDKAGGFDANYAGSPGNVSPQGARFAPEKAESFEVGVKGLVLDNTLNYALDLFTTTFTNLQTSAFVGAATVSVVTNVGKARTRGAEAELTYVPVPGLSLRLAGSYIDAKYLDFPGAACTRAQTALLPPNAPCVQDLSGARTPFASKFSGSFGFDYDQPVNAFTVTVGANLTGRTRYNVSTNNEPLLDQKGYVLVDAHLDLKPENGPWTLSLFGRNLTNQQFFQFGGLVPGLTGSLASSISRGRQLGLRVGLNF
jgi:iron complex outermembrane receptor protein